MKHDRNSWLGRAGDTHFQLLLPDADPFAPAELYHEQSKIFPATAYRFGSSVAAVARNERLLEAMANPYKRYPARPRVALPDPPGLPDRPLVAVLQARSSVRNFSTEPVSINLLSALLHHAAGEREQGRGATVGDGRHTVRFRMSPSAGGLYPIETYLALQRVEGCPPGLYHHDLAHHALERLGGPELASALGSKLLQEDAASSAAALVVLTAVFPRTEIKYGARGYRFALLECGHLMQNLYLVATALQLGFCAIGGFYDDELHTILDVDGVDEAALYVAALGHRQHGEQGDRPDG